jgi:hypothetical protein
MSSSLAARGPSERIDEAIERDAGLSAAQTDRWYWSSSSDMLNSDTRQGQARIGESSRGSRSAGVLSLSGAMQPRVKLQLCDQL